MRDEEAKSPRKTGPKANSARKASATGPREEEKSPRSPRKTDLNDPAVRQNVQDVAKVQHKVQQKAAEKEEKEKALHDHKNYVKSKAEKMTIAKFKKDFE